MLSLILAAAVATQPTTPTEQLGKETYIVGRCMVYMSDFSLWEFKRNLEKWPEPVKTMAKDGYLKAVTESYEKGAPTKAQCVKLITMLEKEHGGN